ncbi:hypothetical protein H310_04818 [Aphanomyces invadans]|uniref:ubiquitinyl hydrolase 1 n=1 Tax=Aphanomyces invadans TaxID=157072 RepID=A0A024UBR5_9STRA|nr:hypothetical protein H310_04818 [Aphanomyces invadans]ETW03322.1 hypothetical protein H310_04818 [Aphanomyces invadans]|eukprot:XP_008867551.1 hypothetical protein H310_04818 [Aphanomyces invadans]
MDEVTQESPKPCLTPLASLKTFDVDKDPTDAGLANQSNFCFLNATLHCIFRSPQFLTSLYRTIRRREGLGDISPIEVAKAKCCSALLETGLTMKDDATRASSNCVDVVELGLTAAMRSCSPSLIAQTPFRQVQQDAEECLSFFFDILDDEATNNAPPSESLLATQLLQAIHSASSTDPATYAHLVERLAKLKWADYTSRHPSFVARQFGAQVVRGSSCQNCRRLTCHMQETSVLSVALHSSTLPMSLESCLDQFKSIEAMVNDNQVWCGYCQSKTDQSIQTLLVHTPPCIVLQLKRFTCDGAISKNSAGVYFPVHRLNLSRACFARSDVTSSNYRLYAVCAHIGDSLHRGHYIAYCRLRQTHTTSHWLKYDDEAVTSLDESTMLHETLRTAYLLFYERYDIA